MYNTSPYLSTSGRAGYALAISSILASFDVLITGWTFGFQLTDALLFAVNVLAFVAGVLLVVRDPSTRLIGWSLLVQGSTLGNMTTRIGYGLIIGAGALLGVHLILYPRSSTYRFEGSVPYIIICSIVYLLGWLLLLLPIPKPAR